MNIDYFKERMFEYIATENLAYLFARDFLSSRGQKLLVPIDSSCLALELCWVEHSLFDTHSLCYINAPLCVLPLFISSRSIKKGGVGCYLSYSLGCIHQLLEPCNSHSSVRRVNVLVLPCRWMTVVSPAGLARRCVYTYVWHFCPQTTATHQTLFSMFHFVFSSGKQNAVKREGRKQQSRVQSLMKGLLMTSMKDLICVLHLATPPHWNLHC